MATARQVKAYLDGNLLNDWEVIQSMSISHSLLDPCMLSHHVKVTYNSGEVITYSADRVVVTEI